MINIVVSIVQVCTWSTWWKRTQPTPQTQPESSTRWFFSVPAFLFIIFWCVYSLCDVSTSSWLREGFVITEMNLFLRLGDRLSPFSSRWPCTDLYNWYYNIAHVRANRMPPLGVDKTILSPPKRSLSPVRGDSSLSQLFCSLIFDVCIVYVMKKDSIYPPNARISFLFS